MLTTTWRVSTDRNITKQPLIHLTNSDGCELLQKPLWSTYPLDWPVSLKLSSDFMLRRLVTLHEMKLPAQHGDKSRKEHFHTYRSKQIREHHAVGLSIGTDQTYVSVASLWNRRQTPSNSNRCHGTYNACNKQSLIRITFHIWVISRIIWWHTNKA